MSADLHGHIAAAVAALDRHAPGRLRACYLLGAHAGGVTVPGSDLDLLFVLGGSVTAGEGQALVGKCLEAVPREIRPDVTVAGETQLRQAGGRWLAETGRLVFGVDVAASLPLLPPEVTAHNQSRSALTKVRRFFGGEALPYPLVHPSATDPWLGYLLAERGVPTTRHLAVCTTWAANAMIMLQGGDVVWGRGAPAVEAARRQLGEERGDFLARVYFRCRAAWAYAVPDDPAGRAELRGICEQATSFFEAFVERYKAFLIRQINRGGLGRSALIDSLRRVGCPVPSVAGLPTGQGLDTHSHALGGSD